MRCVNEAHEKPEKILFDGITDLPRLIFLIDDQLTRSDSQLFSTVCSRSVASYMVSLVRFYQVM